MADHLNPNPNPNSLPSPNYSKTERIVLLIDLTPLLHLQNPNSYLTSILSSSKTLLSFPPLSASISSFKLFFSSLSPLLSSSSLPSPNSLSFNHSHQTLSSLSQTLNSLIHSSLLGSGSVSKAEFTSSSMAQVIHDYAWDLYDSDLNVDDDLLGFARVRSNLVVLFSPVCRSFNDLCSFMDLDGTDGLLSDNFRDKFGRVFGSVKDAFVSRDIHLSWVDVRFEIKSGDLSSDDECERLFRSTVKGLGWGFCSTDSIVLGSALISFGLIYPMMLGVLSICYANSSVAVRKKVSGQLNLEILDVSGKPLECKYCDLELLDIKTVKGVRPNGLSQLLESGTVGPEIVRQCGGVLECFGDGPVKIDVKSLCRSNKLNKIERHASDVVLVNEMTVDSKKNKEESSRNFFADRVIDLLLKEADWSVKRKSPPLWQILLSFLYRRGYWALLSLTNADCSSTTMGVLKPFTIHSAVLFIPKNDTNSHRGTQFDLSGPNLCESKGETGENVDSVIQGGESRRKHKKHPHRVKDLSWSSFCKSTYEHCDIELEEVYFSKAGDTAKKLKFLKCWMKQVVQNCSFLSSKPDIRKTHSQDGEKTAERLSQLQQESEQPLPTLVEGIAEKGIYIEEATAYSPEAAEAFFSNLSERIQHGLQSGVDLVAFSQRVVCSCVYWLKWKLGADTLEEGQASIEKSDCSTSGGLVAGELIKLLLKDPKQLAGKHKDNGPSSKEHNKKPLKISSEDRVREYELQILFRMEILQSEAAVGIRDSIKHKFVKQICSLLEFIQCNMEDGFFGDFNLTDYVGRNIRSRYSQNLPSIVHRIYEQMDLLLFDDEDESPNPFLNSEDSSQSWRVGDNDRGSEPNSTDDSFSGPSRYNEQSQKENGRATYDKKLVEAQERRERALRFASFTRRAIPELQRVWAPKPPKLTRSQSDSFRRSKRKSRRRESYDMVCETPVSAAKKCLFPREECREDGGSSTSSVHKALFQDESFHPDWRP